jgi:hypothetical protein
MGVKAGGRSYGPRAILLIVAVFCFVLAAAGLTADGRIVALGLAAFVGAFLLGEL